VTGSDTDRFAAIRGDLGQVGEEVSDLGAYVAELTEKMVDILGLVGPLLRQSAATARQHRARSASIHHTGRHRRDRQPPFCGGVS
jgi:hypothetical protein